MARVVLDASVVIAYFDANDRHHRAAVSALASHRSAELICPASVYAEVLAGPFRRGAKEIHAVERFFAEFAIRVEPIGVEIARRAASLRATAPSLELADGLVIATGEEVAADVVLTADRKWQSVSRRARVI